MNITAPSTIAIDRPNIHPTQYSASDIVAKFGDDLHQLGADYVTPTGSGVIATFEASRAAFVANAVLRDAIGGVQLVVPQTRRLQPELTMGEVTSLIGRLDAVRSVQHLETANHIAVITQDVASRDRLREMLADQVGGTSISVDAALRYHPAI